MMGYMSCRGRKYNSDGMVAPIILSISLFFLFFIYLPSFASGGERFADNYRMEDSVVVIKKGVKTIPDYAFRDRKDIAEIRFETPVALLSIGDYAFLGCENLRKLSLPRSLTSLGEGSFRECSRLKEVEIPSGVVKLPPYLFYWCEGLEKVAMPRHLKSIGRSCFGYCGALEEVDIPSGVKNIGSNAFSCCRSLREVSLPASVNELESYAFSDCSNLRRITFPANSALLGELILSGCDSLEDIYEFSVTPPKFDCNSFLFEPDEEINYNRVVLHVASGRTAPYRTAPGWKLVQKIEDR